MSDLKLFRLEPRGVSEVRTTALNLEKSLQTLIETNLEVILGVRFLATVHLTGKTHGGRIDTLGIDENGCPVISITTRRLQGNFPCSLWISRTGSKYCRIKSPSRGRVNLAAEAPRTSVGVRAGYVQGVNSNGV